MPLVLYCGQYGLISSGEFLHKQNSQLRVIKLFPASFIPSFLLVAQIPADHQSHNSVQYISVREHLYPIEWFCSCSSCCSAFAASMPGGSTYYRKIQVEYKLWRIEKKNSSLSGSDCWLLFFCLYFKTVSDFPDGSDGKGSIGSCLVQFFS